MSLLESITRLRDDLGQQDKRLDRVESHLAEIAEGVRALNGDRGAVVRSSEDLKRVGLFVDVQNMYYAARQVQARLDFGALMETATQDRRLIKATAYVVQNRDINQSGFLTMLQQKNYDVRRKDLKVRQDGSAKGDWDIEIALDILRLAPSVDVVVLVSGDGDFTPLVTHVKTLGPAVEVYSFTESTARELMEAADKHVPLDGTFLIPMSPAG